VIDLSQCRIHQKLTRSRANLQAANFRRVTPAAQQHDDSIEDPESDKTRSHRSEKKKSQKMKREDRRRSVLDAKGIAHLTEETAPAPPRSAHRHRVPPIIVLPAMTMIASWHSAYRIQSWMSVI
jgi:hypothetical protein